MVQDWICNSSICMTKRGLKPTGIAIFEAQQQGFPSVAHYLQVLFMSELQNLPCHDAFQLTSDMWMQRWHAA